MSQSKQQFVTSVSNFNGLVLTSVEPVRIGDWFIKASMTNLDSIFVIMHHAINKQTKLQFFDDEAKANKFVMMWLNR